MSITCSACTLCADTSAINCYLTVILVTRHEVGTSDFVLVAVVGKLQEQSRASLEFMLSKQSTK